MTLNICAECSYKANISCCKNFESDMIFKVSVRFWKKCQIRILNPSHPELRVDCLCILTGCLSLVVSTSAVICLNFDVLLSSAMLNSAGLSFHVVNVAIPAMADTLSEHAPYAVIYWIKVWTVWSHGNSVVEQELFQLWMAARRHPRDIGNESSSAP